MHAGTVVGDETHRVRLVVQKTGLGPPSYVLKEGLKRGVVPSGASRNSVAGGLCVTQRQVARGGGSARRARIQALWPFLLAGLDPTSDRVLVEWVVRGKSGIEVRLSATHERAGTVRAAAHL